jgi:hypothetical protein
MRKNAPAAQVATSAGDDFRPHKQAMQKARSIVQNNGLASSKEAGKFPKKTKIAALTIELEGPCIKDLELLSRREGLSLKEYVEDWVRSIPGRELDSDEGAEPLSAVLKRYRRRKPEQGLDKTEFERVEDLIKDVQRQIKEIRKLQADSLAYRVPFLRPE